MRVKTYDLAGPEGARTIVFLHGMRVTRRMWEPQMGRLSSRFRVIAADLPGHGSRKDELFHVERAVEELAEVIDQAAGGRALVVGLSLGGYIAMEFGARYPRKAAGNHSRSHPGVPRAW